MHQFEKIRFDLQGHVALIDLNSPQTMNRLYGPFFRDLNRAADEIEKNDGIFVAVITGGEKVFCTGDDVTQPEELQAQKELGLFDWMKIVQDCMTRISQIKKPVIAAVAGYALGGGLEMALACDFIVASENAKFGLPEAKIGVFPCGGGTQRLPRLIGRALAKELSMHWKSVWLITSILKESLFPLPWPWHRRFVNEPLLPVTGSLSMPSIVDV